MAVVCVVSALGVMVVVVGRRLGLGHQIHVRVVNLNSHTLIITTIIIITLLNVL